MSGPGRVPDSDDIMVIVWFSAFVTLNSFKPQVR